MFSGGVFMERMGSCIFPMADYLTRKLLEKTYRQNSPSPAKSLNYAVTAHRYSPPFE